MKPLVYILCLLTAFLAACHGTTIVAYSLPERDANEIVVLLSNHGIAATKIAAVASATAGASTIQLWNISVPASRVTDAIAILNQSGLPRTKGTSLLDLFGAQGLVPSDLQNKIRYQEGLSEQLATTIRKMDGIIDADVQITFPQDESEGPPLTASVYVKHRGVLDNPNSLMITKIKRLVSSALPGLSIDNVSVVTDRALIADLTGDNLTLHEEYEYVSIWGVVIAKQSVGWFRTILYFLMALLFLLACALIWVVWKIYPMLASWGFASLLSPQPYEPLPLLSAPLPESAETAPPPAEVEESAFEIKTRE